MVSAWRLQKACGFEKLAEALETLSVDDLKKLAAFFSDRPPKRKAELIGHLRRQLQGNGLRRLWERLDDLSHKAVAEAVYNPSEPLNAALFRAKYRASPPPWRMRDSSYGQRKEPPRPLGMFLFGAGWVPNDLRNRLEAIVPEPEKPSLATVSELPAHAAPQGAKGHKHAATKLTQEDTALAALHDVRAMLALVDEGQVSVGPKTGQVSPTGVTAILSALRNGDFLVKGNKLEDVKRTMRAFAWPLLLQAGRLAEPGGSRLRLTRSGKKALTEPPQAVIRELWSRWLKSTIFDEFRRVSVVKGQTKPRAMTAVAGRRRAIVRCLQQARFGEWVELDEFLRYLVASGEGFEVSGNCSALYIADPHYGSLFYDGYADWLPKWYTMVFLWEYAATLGLVDVAFTQPEDGHKEYRGNWGTDDYDCLCPHEGLYYFRINTLGAWVLELTPQYVPPKQDVRPVLRVLPNLDVAAVGERLDPADALFLGRFARPKGDGVWSLRLASLLRAVERGMLPAQIREFLEAKSAEPGIPKPVAALLADLERRTGRIVDQGPARIYACDDPELAQRVMSDAKLRRLCRLADDRLLVVPADLDQAFREALRHLGYAAPAATAE